MPSSKLINQWIRRVEGLRDETNLMLGGAYGPRGVAFGKVIESLEVSLKEQLLIEYRERENKE